MAHAGAPQRAAVVIDGDRAVQDLVVAVAVDVPDLDAVLALALVLERGALVGPPPQLLQLAIRSVQASTSSGRRCRGRRAGSASCRRDSATPSMCRLDRLPVWSAHSVGLPRSIHGACRSPAGVAVVDHQLLGPVEDEALAAVERLGLRRRVGRAAQPRPPPCRRRRDRARPSARTRCRG